MADLNLNELRKVAEAATPGPWEVADEGYDERYVYDSAAGQMCWTPDLPGHWSLADATHIATFDPSTVLALLDRVAELEAKVERLAAHDAEVARQAEARALREAADQLTEIADDYDTCSELHAALRECDLDTAHWLRARAARVTDTTATEGGE